MPPRPRDGSSKAKIYDAFFADGYDAAMKLASGFDLAPNTARSWCLAWGKTKGAPPLPAPAPKKGAKGKAPKVPREKVKEDKPARVLGIKDFPHFPTERKARIWADHRTNRVGMDSRAMIPHEIDGQWYVIPLHMGPDIPKPTFKDGDIVTNLGIRNSRATVIGAGPDQSVIRYTKDVPGRHREPCVNNRYLMLLPPPEGKDKKGKASRERL